MLNLVLLLIGVSEYKVYSSTDISLAESLILNWTIFWENVDNYFVGIIDRLVYLLNWYCWNWSQSQSYLAFKILTAFLCLLTLLGLSNIDYKDKMSLSKQ